MMFLRGAMGWTARGLVTGARGVRPGGSRFAPAFAASARASSSTARLSVVAPETEGATAAWGGDGAPAVEAAEVVEAAAAEAAEAAAEPAAADPREFAARDGVTPKQAAKLAGRGLTTMTEIQHLSFDAVYAGNDLLGKSRTGTGKTMAFGLPLIERLADRARSGEYDAKKRGRGPAVLCLAPTRELAKQVESELHLLAATHGLSTTCFHGGVSYVPQERALRNGVDIVVATVGRVIDHIERGNLRLGDTYHVVLDEADEMLSMGFADDVERIFSECPAGRAKAGKGPAPARGTPPGDFDLDELLGDAPAAAPPAAAHYRPQTLLFSATNPRWVKQLTRKFMASDHEFVDVVGDGAQQAATSVSHKAVLVPRSDAARASLLEDIIAVEISARSGQASDDAAGGGGRVIVFTATKKECDELAGGPAFSRLAAQVLHGDIGQSQREATLAQFRKGSFAVLVATDVAARGIDVKGVDLVVQYRTPRDAEGYVHRSGRTGRAGRDGTAVVLYDEREARDVADLERQTGVQFERAGPPSASAVLGAAARDATRALASVEDAVLPYFGATAADLCAAELGAGATPETERLVAKLLAAVSRKTDVAPRSLVTGEPGKTTLVMEAPRALKTSDVVYAVSKLLERVPEEEGGGGGGARVGAVRVGRDATKAVFDLPADRAIGLLKFVEDQDFDKFAFAECDELPALQPTDNRGGGGQRRGGGGGGYRRGGGGGGGYRGGGGGGGGYRGGGGGDRY